MSAVLATNPRHRLRKAFADHQEQQEQFLATTCVIESSSANLSVQAIRQSHITAQWRKL